MECLTDDVFLKFYPDTLAVVRKTFGYEKLEDVNKAIDILDDWVKKQNHFVKKDFSRDYLERNIMCSKGSIEKAKTRLESLCTMKTLLPHFFVPFDFEKDFKIPNAIKVVLPKLTKEHERVFAAKYTIQSFSPSLLFNIYRLTVVMFDYVRSRDYSTGTRVMLDVRDVNLTDFVKNCNFNDLHQVLTVFLNGYGVRVIDIHLLTSSKFIHNVITMVKPMLSPKIRERFRVHKTLESLHEFLPKDILPLEYGGQEKSLYKIHEELVEALTSKDFNENWTEMCRASTNESCRQTDKFNDLYMGTFRSLSVD